MERDFPSTAKISLGKRKGTEKSKNLQLEAGVSDSPFPGDLMDTGHQ